MSTVDEMNYTRSLENLAEAVGDYLVECANEMAPDYGYRATLKRKMARLHAEMREVKSRLRSE